MNIILPYGGIVLLVGPSNSGKTSFLNGLVEKDQILPSEIVSSDTCRKIVSDIDFIETKNQGKEETNVLFDQYKEISTEAFTLLDGIIESRCRLNKLSIVDATHLYAEDRKRYIAIAKKYHVPIVTIVFDVDLKVLLERDRHREHPRGTSRIKQQHQVFQKEKRFIKKEGYAERYVISNTEMVQIKRNVENPLHLDVGEGIDMIGDIHGCYDEMIQLLEKLGYEKNEQQLYVHPTGRKFLSLGDVMSRGPKSLTTLQFFLNHINAGLAYMIDSNHGWKIARWLDGKKVTLNHGDELVESDFKQYEAEFGQGQAKELKGQLKQMLLKAPSHYVLTKKGIPTVVCTHAGIKDKMIGKQSRAISDFCRYGDSDGLDEKGKPIRKDWTIHHQTSISIVWGHDPKQKPLIVNNTINIDQGVVFGGALTAYRYPEKEFVSVPAKKDYSNGTNNPLLDQKKKRLDPPNIGRLINGYTVQTDKMGEIHISKEYVIPAIDTISHATVPIEELVYLPPTMSPSPTPSPLDKYLEHPKEAIDYYRSVGIHKLIAEKKHMGSRGVLYLFKDEEVAVKYVGRKTLGVIYTRTGRAFFDQETEMTILSKMNAALTNNDYFTKYNTDFILLDAEIMPWNLKAKELISRQYAHVAENAIFDRRLLKEKLEMAVGTNEGLEQWLKEYDEKLTNAHVFKDVFQKYCWEINDIDSIQIAPFHLLAHSNEMFFHQPHTWHMEKNKEFAMMDNLFVETEYRVIDDAQSEEQVIQWWEEITADGHEGIVIKPEIFLTTSQGKLIQPAIKVRGQKYLHIIYGMDYLQPKNLSTLKKRNTGKKQRLALKEFSLGIEGIQRLINGESLERVHECVLAILAMETDPVDPRL